MPMTRSHYRSANNLSDEEDIFVPDNGTLNGNEQNQDHTSDMMGLEQPPMNSSGDQVPNFPPNNSCDRVLNATENERVKAHLRKLHKTYVTTLNTTL